MSGPREFNIGGMWEYSSWVVRFDETCVGFLGASPCPHCYGERMVTHTRFDNSTYDTREWTCPRVVVALNEAGCNSTGVCLDCILDAAKKIGCGRVNAKGAIVSVNEPTASPSIDQNGTITITADGQIFFSGFTFGSGLVSNQPACLRGQDGAAYAS